MKRSIVTTAGFLVVAAVTMLGACSDDEDASHGSAGAGATAGSGGDAQGGAAEGGGGSATALQIPTLGAQIDRNGRPAINTAAYQTFTDDSTRTTARAGYNADDDPSAWGSYVSDIAGTIAILDGLDATCGNQAGFEALGNPGYGTLATVLAHDWLLIDSTSTECDAYLGVEASLLGLVPAGKCGGRTPSMDVIETSYSVLAGVGLAGFDDGITAPASAMVNAFPYLAAPN